MRGPAEGPEPVREPIFEPTPDQEVADELDFHLEMRARELIARGVEPGLARQKAREHFTDFDRAAEECRRLARERSRSVRRSRWLVDVMQDVRFAFRLLRQRPAFALLAILPLALGIGAATTMYSVADVVMIRPLPFPEPDRLVAIWATESSWRNSAVSIPWQSVVIGQSEYDALRERAHTLSAVAAWSRTSVTLNTDNRFEPVPAVRATASIFPLLGIRPVLGRVFRPEETVLGGPHIALVSWEAWQARFHGDSALVGRSVVFGDSSHYTVVGVLPRGVRLDRTQAPPAFWLPAFTEPYDAPLQHNRSYRGLGRLAAGATVAQANAEVGRIFTDVKTEWKGHADGTSGRAAIWKDDQVAAARPSLTILTGAVGLLLLIACINVAMLMLGEAVRRRPELFARQALGASRTRLVRQLLTESVVIAGTAAGLGTAAAWAGVRVLVHSAPSGIPGIGTAAVDGRVLLFAAVCAVAIGAGFGLLPALALLRWRVDGRVRIGAGQTARGTVMLQRGLIAAEVALSLAMLVGCSLLGRSLVRLTAVDPGFVVNGLFEVTTFSTGKFWRDDDRITRFNDAAIDALRSIPGVTAASAASGGLFDGGYSSSPMEVVGETYPDGGPDIQQRAVMPDYLRTIGVPLLAGRDFTAADRAGSEPVVILSQASVARDFHGQSPIGREVTWQGNTWTVIGVAGDVLDQRLTEAARPTIYVPAAQAPGNVMVMLVRASADSRALTRLVKARVDGLDPAVTVTSVDPVESLIHQSYAEERYRTLLGSLFGFIAAALAGAGIFGVISRTVAQRMREAGIRAALGARGSTLTTLMLRDTAIGAAIGIVIGVGIAVLLARALSPYLFGVRAGDPISYLAAFVVLGVTTVAATIPPARRAARVDPVRVLRVE